MKDSTRLIIFLLLTFGLSWTLEFLVIVPAARSGGYGTNPVVQLLVASVMFIPALCVLLTRLLTREGFSDSKIAPHFNKRTVKYYLFAWFGPQVLCTLGAVVYFLIFPGKFDPTHGYIMEQYAAAGVEISPEKVNLTMLSQFLMALTIAPLLNCINCFGEEWGWRGYMLPKLMGKMGFAPAAVIGGLIWGIWHAPIIAVGHNYGLGYPGAPWTGIAMMCLFCVVVGVFFSWLTVKTDSCLPAVFGHGALNGFAAAPLYYVADNGDALMGPSATGLIGMTAFIIVAALILFRRRKQQPSL